MSTKYRGIYQTKDGRYFIKYNRGKNPDDPGRRKEYFGRGPDALLRARARRAELFEEKITGVTFSQLANQYMAAKVHDLSATEADNWYWKMKSVIFPVFGGMEVARIRHDRLDEYRAKRTKEGKKQTTIHRELSYIRAILNWGVRRRIIAVNPMAGYEMPRKDGERIRPISDDDFEKILEKAAPHVQRAMLVAYHTGLRPGAVELLSLTWDAFSERERILRITSAKKGGLEGREVPLLESFSEQLKKWRDEDGGSGYIIHFNGRRIKTSIKTAWKAAKKRAGITGRLRQYSIRHRFVTRLLDSGADLKAVSEMVGHKDITMTVKVYQESSSKAKRQAIEQAGIKSVPGQKKEEEQN